MKKFTIGLIFGAILFPILNSLTEVAFSWIEVLKIKPTRIINDWNKEIVSEDQSLQDTNVIGFQYASSDEYDDEEYEDD